MKKLNLVKVEWSNHRLKLKEKIELIGLNASDPNLFTTIDKACSNEWAFLFLAPDGFVVLRPRYRREQSFIEVTVAYSNGKNTLHKYQSDIIELAQIGNAKFIEFLTSRKGFDKIAPINGWFKFGYHRHLAIWRYKL